MDESIQDSQIIEIIQYMFEGHSRAGECKSYQHLKKIICEDTERSEDEYKTHEKKEKNKVV